MSVYGDAVGLRPSGNAEDTAWPWLEDLVEQYRARAQKPPRPRPMLLALVGLAVMALALLAPVLLHLDRAAYPVEPAKEDALQVCSRADPTFVRFLAREREACYERVRDLAARAALTTIGAHGGRNGGEP